ncbi:MAG: 4-oxalocrotonate decarboxylase [Myxococcales bacterium]|nr:4-oxalocrotonate decarboxylase [Myxococcales bacterium]
MGNPLDIEAVAARLHMARRDRLAVPRLTLELPDLDLDDAYRIQAAGIGLRQAAGERVVGWKMGLTSQAKRLQMNLHGAIYGVLTDAMAIDRERGFGVGGGIHPRVEAEIAFRLGRPLRTGIATHADVLAACDGVAAALEVLDSRYVGFKYFSLPDVVADNSSSSHFAVGAWSDLHAVDVADVALRMTVGGREVIARSSAISGHPVQSLVDLCALLAGQIDSLPAGSVILSGAATSAEPLVAGDAVLLEVQGLAAVSFLAK